MNRLSLFFACLIWTNIAFTQQTQSINNNKIEPLPRTIEANFLSSYYEQTGDNAAVTGGRGTEELTDNANVFVVNIPIDSVQAIDIMAGADYYTSASTDQIDNNMSSASSKDTRTFATLGYRRLNLKKGETYTAKIGVSNEYDVSSVSGGLSYTKSWNEANSELTLAGQVFIDNWRFFFPAELHRSVSLPTKTRQSYNASLTYSQILSPKTQMSLSAEMVYMDGLLSTPFHRVYFADTSTPDIERLPENRIKIPLSARVNHAVSEHLIIRSYYRYYWDDFGIQAHTIEIEPVFKLGKAISLSPFYRFHTQTASKHFAPYAEHLSSSEFYTSDYDLSDFNANMFGLGFKYYPVHGIVRSKAIGKNKRIFMLKYIEFRGGIYERSTGLSSSIGSINIGLSIK